MSDFSYFSLFTAGLACFAPLAAAYTQPVGPVPVGNPISEPGLNTIVQAGTNFTITWQPTTQGTVTLLLLKGPSTNAVPQYPIVEKTENDGVYVWQVKDNLEPSANGAAQGYGIQLIDDATGQYQYTTQFGISNPYYNNGAVSSSSAISSASSSASSESAKPTTSAGSKTATASATYSYSYNSTTYCSTSSAYVPYPPVGTGNAYPSQNATMVAPTGYTSKMTTSASTYNMPSATASTTTPAQQTGAASTVAGGVFGAVLAAGFAVLAM